MLKISLFNRNKTIPTRFYSEIHKPQTRLTGVVVSSEGKGADEWITIEEDESKNFFHWVVWPFDYFGIFGKPINVGDRVSFIEDEQAKVKWRAKSLIIERTGKPPGIGGQELTH